MLVGWGKKPTVVIYPKLSLTLRLISNKGNILTSFHLAAVPFSPIFPDLDRRGGISFIWTPAIIVFILFMTLSGKYNLYSTDEDFSELSQGQLTNGFGTQALGSKLKLLSAPTLSN